MKGFKKFVMSNNMNKESSHLPGITRLLAVFGFLLIIATGTSLVLNQSQIPPYVAIIGLVLLVVATILQKRNQKMN